MTQAIKANTEHISNDTVLIKEYTMKIVEQVAKQQEILEQIAWVRAIVSQKPLLDEEKRLIIDKYLDSVTDYAGSVCGHSVSEHVAEEMDRMFVDESLRSDNTLNEVSGPDPLAVE